MPDIIIIVEGGLVQNVLCNSRGLRIYKIDYDIEGADESDLTPIPQIGLGTTSPAFACKEIPEIATDEVMSTLIAAIEKETTV
jgi:hypothetical protein